MSIEFKCSGCGNTLRVPDEHAGRQAKCPVCEQLSTIPDPSTSDDSSPDIPPGEAPTQYADSAATGQAGESPFPTGQTGEPVGDGEPSQNPYATPKENPNPYAAAPQTAPSRLPHRGGVILTLGILSLLCCGLLGIPAWLMANEDLSQMERGVMDVNGRGLTMAGKVLGIIALIVMALGILVQFGAAIANA